MTRFAEDERVTVILDPLDDNKRLGESGLIDMISKTVDTNQDMYWVRFKDGRTRPYLEQELERGEVITTKVHFGGDPDAPYIEVRVHISREGILITYTDSEGFDKAYVDVELRRGGFYVSTEDENSATEGRILVHDAVALQGRGDNQSS
jgi:hypothetical protein